ncbi:MIF-like protein mif-2 [Varroa jacobsoni]|uniref:D-dopachrome decarboxylase n=1 Tax=Varroa destructor TaxID=109461 RepID=A0A7M7M3K2_VARDE|nr:MIF-like protein mif-2 [Varroa destructor]XP_022694925.1 MIF-like protein mif-2 [Varroa jacobsoni]
MPLCVLRTNLRHSAFGEDFHRLFSKCVADALNKPHEKVTVVLENEANMSRGGSKESTVWLTIESVGVFSAEKNKQISQTLRAHLRNLILVPENRVVITLRDLPKDELV